MLSEKHTGTRRDLHDHWMRLALRESRKALPACRPNPPVGCVIVCNGDVLARGYTNPPGRDHAEIMALRQLPLPAPPVSVYVTLEPCSFDGRTPSCAEALVAARIDRVFVGMIDPHPRNQGRGIEIMRAGGIAVEVGILQDEVEAVLAPYLIRE
jgi:pyrimidine deaminase RibD-like protein